MASAISFLVNDNPVQNVKMLDAFTNCHIFEHQMAKHYNTLVKNAKEIEIGERYDLRPDLLSYENYGTNFWYPAILTVNKLGSILQFKSSYLNKKCLVPSYDDIVKVMQMGDSTPKANQI
jgi:hypothetical protein